MNSPNQISNQSASRIRRFDDAKRQSNGLKLAVARMRLRPSPAPNCGPLPSLERLRELFIHDDEKGVLIARISRSTLKAGQVVGTRKPKQCAGYIKAFVDGKSYFLHRLIWKYVTGRDPAGSLDHINGNRSDNRMDNLREVTTLENNRHRTVVNSNTGHLGVSQCAGNGLYLAAISVGSSTVNLGKYDSLNCALAAREHAEKVLDWLPETSNKEAA